MQPIVLIIIDAMLGKDSLFTYQQIADEVKLTERTVRNHVPEIRLILNKFGLELRTTRGKGCEVLGAPVDRTILAGDIGRARSQNQFYKAKERVWIIILYLILLKNPVSISYLTGKLFIARSSIYKDIQTVRDWLRNFQIELQTSHRGLSIISGEKRNRLALVNVLLEINDFNVAFFPDRIRLYIEQMKRPDSNERAKLNAVFVDILRRNSLALAPNENERLLLHFMVSFHRIKQGLFVTLGAGTKEKLKASVSKAHLQDYLPGIEQKFGIRLNETEVLYLSGMLLSSKISTIEESELTLKANADEIAREFYDVVARHYLLREPELFIKGLSHHFQALFRRAQYIWDCHNPMKREVIEFFPQVYLLASKIIPNLQQHVPVAIPDDEIAFIAMHIMAAIERSRLPLQALFLYDQTFSEIKYALSLVENHLAEVHIERILQINDLNQTALEGIDIVFSTFPIQLNGVNCFIFPLIPDVKFITTLKSTLTMLFEQVNNQRLILHTVQ